MPSIAGTSVIAFTDPVQLRMNSQEFRSREGVDGEDVIFYGLRGQDFELGFWADYTTAGNLAAAKLYFNGLCEAGNLITLVDNMGSIWPYYLPRAFNVIWDGLVIAGSGGVNGGSYVLQAGLVLRPMG